MVDLFLSNPEVQPADLRLRERVAAVTGTSYPRTAMDSVAAPAEAASRMVAYVRPALDVLAALSEAAARQVAFRRPVVELVTLQDAASRAAGYARVRSEVQAAPLDSSVRALAWARSASELVALTESTQRQLAAARVASDSLALTADPSRQLFTGRLASDAVSVDVQARREAGYARASLTAVTAPLDSISAVVAFARRASAGVVTPLDSAVTVAGITVFRVASDVVAAVQALAGRQYEARRQGAEPVELVDQPARQVEVRRIPTETLAVQAAAQRSGIFVRVGTQVVEPLVVMTQGVRRQITFRVAVTQAGVAEALAARVVEVSRTSSSSAISASGSSARTISVLRTAVAELLAPVASLIRQVLSNRRPVRLSVQAVEQADLALGTVEHLG